jgi:hypothetical protein
MGLIKTEHLDFKPDYTLSTRDLYVKVAKAVISASGTTVLAQVHPQERNAIVGLPSWAQDWSLEAQDTRFIDISHFLKAKVHHGFQSKDDGKDILSVQGIKLDTIKYCTQAYDVVRHVGRPDYAPLRRRAYNLRIVLQGLLCHLENQKHSELLLKLFRCCSDVSPVADRERAMQALTSRDPVETVLLQSQHKIPSESEEKCAECTGGRRFENRLEALLCPHLPILYDDPDKTDFSDYFTENGFSKLRTEAKLSGLCNILICQIRR